MCIHATKFRRQPIFSLLLLCIFYVFLFLISEKLSIIYNFFSIPFLKNLFPVFGIVKIILEQKEVSIMTPSLILASSSPRRRKILEMAGYQFSIISPKVNEQIPDHMQPGEAVEVLAKRKADEVFSMVHGEGKIILAADTVVALHGKIFGKPRSKEDAFHILSTLSDNTHCVYTGVCIISPTGKTEVFHEVSEVTFYPLSPDEIWDYIATGEPMDKAGAYGMQEGKGCTLVKRISGDYYNIVGLPIGRVVRILRNVC